MGFFVGIPVLLLLLPIVLLGLDVFYKWVMFKHPPYDSVADIALAGLSFSAVHVITKLLANQPVPAWALFWLFVQFGVWPACLFWSERLEFWSQRRDRPPLKRGYLYLSYLVGGALFTYGTGRVLALLP